MGNAFLKVLKCISLLANFDKKKIFCSVAELMMPLVYCTLEKCYRWFYLMVLSAPLCNRT